MKANKNARWRQSTSYYTVKTNDRLCTFDVQIETLKLQILPPRLNMAVATTEANFIYRQFLAQLVMLLLPVVPFIDIYCPLLLSKFTFVHNVLVLCFIALLLNTTYPVIIFKCVFLILELISYKCMTCRVAMFSGLMQMQLLRKELLKQLKSTYRSARNRCGGTKTGKKTPQY